MKIGSSPFESERKWCEIETVQNTGRGNLHTKFSQVKWYTDSSISSTKSMGTTKLYIFSLFKDKNYSTGISDFELSNDLDSKLNVFPFHLGISSFMTCKILITT